MHSYSEISRKRLDTCHPDLQAVFEEVLDAFDHTVLEGYRDQERQDRLFDEGKSRVRWPDSRHNRDPSEAVDAIPYPVDWDDRERMTLFAGYVIAVADQMLKQGRIEHRILWGGDWDRDTEVTDNQFHDLVHFQLCDP